MPIRTLYRPDARRSLALIFARPSTVAARSGSVEKRVALCLDLHPAVRGERTRRTRRCSASART